MENNERKFDEMLDRALADYSNVEPRAGLDGRILANLATVETDKKSWLRWWPAVGFAAALIAVVTFFAIARGTSKTPTVAVKESPRTAVPGLSRSPKVTSTRQVATAIRPEHTPRAKREPRVAAPVAQLAVAKQPVFPAPSPLTPQEHLLFAYLRKTDPLELAANAKPDDPPLQEKQLNQTVPVQKNLDSNTNAK